MEIYEIMGAVIVDADGDDVGTVLGISIYDEHIVLLTDINGIETEEIPDPKSLLKPGETLFLEPGGDIKNVVPMTEIIARMKGRPKSGEEKA